ncbi:MAG: hypothetical protein VYE46_07260 [Cyanobacteriota bacterium]|nr:hypothetical protein [Cyanobacteriota bacterium]
MGEPSEQVVDTDHGSVAHRQKKRHGMPPINKGTNASKVLASQRHHPLQSVSGATGIVYELPKGWGCPLATPRLKHRPDVRFSDWSSPS